MAWTRRDAHLSRGTDRLPLAAPKRATSREAHTMLAISPAIFSSGTILSAVPLSTTAFGMP